MTKIAFEAENIPAEKLPKPAGWRLLIAPVKINETSTGGIVLVDRSIEELEYFRNIAKVVAVGDECYTHPKFQGGVPLDQRTPTPWCKVGDIISYSSYTGAEMTINHDGIKSKLRVINDDEVVTTIHDMSIFKFL